MEKLIELFKDYVDNHGTDTKDIEREYGVIDYGQGFQYGTREYLYETIISKKFGFIKWLVDNDKIDFYQLDTVKSTNNLIMALAIQDNPIEFLISLLK